MGRLPTPNGDSGTWGTVLNDFLLVAHNADGSLQNTGTMASKADDAAVVHIAGAETIGGAKAFSVSPTVPTPTSGTQIANKTYVDSVAVRASTPTAEDQNLIAWTYDPLQAVGFTSTSPGTLALMRVIVRRATTITNAIYAVTSGGTSLTTGQNWVGLYDFSGNLVAQTSDQTTNMSGTGIITAPWSSPYAASAGNFWLAMLNNGSSTPSYARMGANSLSDLASVGLTAATRRFGAYGSGLTTLPASIAPSSISAVTNGLFWMAIA